MTRRFSALTTAALIVALAALILVPYVTPVSSNGGPPPAPMSRLDGSSGAPSSGQAPIPTPTGRDTGTPMPGHDPPPAPTGRLGGGGPPTGTPPTSTQCTGYGDNAVDQNGVSVDAWAPGLRKACGYAYENGDNPMPAGTPFPQPRPFRLIEHTEPVFGFKVFYIGANTATKCDDLRIIFHQGDGVGGRNVRFHSMQYAIAHCDASGNYLGYTDVAAYADTGGVLDVNPAMPNGDNGTRPAKLAPTLTDVQQFLVFEVWYVEFFIDNPTNPTHGTPPPNGYVRPAHPILTVRPGFDIHNVSAYLTFGDFTTVNYTCSVLGGGVPGDPGCQYDGAKRGLSHPDIIMNNAASNAQTDFFTDVHGGFNGPLIIQQHVFKGALTRLTCPADGGTGDPNNCYPEFVRGPNSPGANKSSSPYQSPGPNTYAVSGLKFPN